MRIVGNMETKNMETRIIFDKSMSRFILEALGCKIDKQGYITKRGKRVKTISNETIKLSDFGGVVKAKNNRMIYVKNNIFDLIRLVDMQEEGKVTKNMVDLKGLKLPTFTS